MKERYKLGDFVTINPQSTWSSQLLKTEGLPGKITSVRGSHGGLMDYVVKWPNGYENAYDDEDLLPYYEIPKKNSEAKSFLEEEY
jgi:hypothetical protein